jgi:arylsulfatase A-like enzyme
MILLFLAAVYCLVDAFLVVRFQSRLHPAHFSLGVADFWSSGKKYLPLFFLCCAALWLFPLLSLALILFSKHPHPLLTLFRDLKQKRPQAHFPLSSQTPQGPKLFSMPTDDKPHILFVFLESFRAKNVGCLGAKIPLSPHFDQLAEKGILFTRFHSTGNLTSRAVLASLFGIPAADRPWHLDRYADLSLIGLPQILSRHGYLTAFIQGGSTSFDHQGEFFEKQGFQTILGKRDIAKPGTSWGVYDEYLMPYAASWLERQKTPAFLNIATITNHHPWLHPNGECDYFKTFAYTDWVLHLLIEELRKKGLLEKSVLFLFGDHGQEDSEINQQLYQDNIHVPLLIYAEGRQKHAVIDTVSSQVDLLPTLLDLFQFSDPHHSLGKSLLRPSNRPIFFSHPFDKPVRGCRHGNWKYILREEKEELYDLSVDPEEKVNRAGEVELKEMTVAYFETLNRYYSHCGTETKESHHYLDFSNSVRITDEALENVAKSRPRLASIDLSHCLLVTNDGVGSLLNHCPKLEKLFIDGLDEVTGQGWKEASELVHFRATHCPRMEIDWIARLPSLKILQLGSANICDDDLIELAKKQKGLIALYLSRLYGITDRGLRALLEANPYLMVLSLEDCPQVTREALAERGKLLRYLMVN